MQSLTRKRDKYDDKLVADMTDKQRKDKIERLEEHRDEVVRRIEKLMIRISKESKMHNLRDRKLPLGDAPNDRDFED